MWDWFNPTDLSGLSDFGTGWRHHSWIYNEMVRRFQFIDSPIAQYEAPLKKDLAQGRAGNDHSSTAALLDPLARELWVHENLQRYVSGRLGDPFRAYAESIVHVHEPIHAGIAEVFQHRYVEDRLRSFETAITLLTHAPEENLVSYMRNLINPMVNNLWLRQVGAEVTHEGMALREQRRFFRQRRVGNSGRGWDSILSEFAHYEAIDYYCSEGHFPEDLTRGSITHALGDWLQQQLSESPWKFDPLDFAFRPAKAPSPLSDDVEPKSLPSDDDLMSVPTPDSVVFIAARIPPQRLEGLTADQQRELLFSKVRTEIGEPYNCLVGGHGDSSVGYDRVSSESLLIQFIEQQRKYISANETFHQLPLFTAAYPGMDRHQTLSWILNCMASDTVRRDGRLVRRLWLEKNLEWALSTDILRIAIQLWHLRDHTVIPVLRTYQRSNEKNLDGYLALVDSILDKQSFNMVEETGNAHPEYLEKTTISDGYVDKVARLHNRTPKIREQYSWLLDQLERLGRAIYQGDSQTVSEFY